VIPATPIPTRTLRRAVAAGAERHPLRVDQVAPSLIVLRGAWHSRRERLWLALVAIPLAETATGVTGQWWTWPLLLGGAWACTRSRHWTWLLSLELGAIGAMWAMLGTNALVHLPDDRLPVGAAWVSFPLALAAAGAMNRHRHNRPEAYFPLR
jgi:hypothetical protein